MKDYILINWSNKKAKLTRQKMDEIVAEHGRSQRQSECLENKVIAESLQEAYEAGRSIGHTCRTKVPYSKCKSGEGFHGCD